MPPPDPTPAFRRFQAHGDVNALAAVFDATAAELLRVAHHLVRDLDVAEDLVQSTFVAAIENRATFRSDARVVPWLVGILTNLARKQQARDARRPDPERMVHRSATGPGEAAAERELSTAVTTAIQALPPAYRPVLMLHLRHGFAAHEIALDLGRAPATVRKQLQRGLDQLRRSLPVGIAGLGLTSIAAAGAGLAPTREIAAIRQALLSHAASAVPIPLTLGGILLMKKLLTAVAAALLLGTTWALATWALATSGAWDESPGLAPTGEVVQQGPAMSSPPKSGPAAQAREVLVPQTPSQPPEDPVPGSRPETLTVRGVVVDGAGKPLARASVFLTEPGSMSTGQVVAKTGADGRFELLETRIGCYVSAFADGWAPCSSQIVEGDPGSTLELRLQPTQPGFAVAGRVVDPDGGPVAGARVVLGRLYRSGGWDGAKRITFPPPLWLRTDAGGRFATTSSQFRAPVYTHADGFAPWEGTLTSPLGRGGTPEQLEIRLQRGATVAGRVLRQGGKPAAGAFLYVAIGKNATPGFMRRRTVVREDGGYRLAGILPGRRELRLSLRGHHVIRHPIDLADGVETPWSPLLRPTATIRGVLQDESGVGLAGYRIRGRSDDGGADTPAVRTAADGSFELTDCVRDRYDLQVFTPGDRAASLALATEWGVPAGTSDCRIRLDADSRAVGRVTAVLQFADGRPTGRLLLCLWRAPFATGRNFHSAPETGLVCMEALPAGEYRLDVRAPDHPVFAKRFTLAPGQDLDLGVLRIPAPAFLRIHSRRSTGDGSQVAIVDSKNVMIATVDVRDGVGKSEVLAPGRYTVRDTNGPVGTEEKVQLGSGETKDIHMDLVAFARCSFRFLLPNSRDLVLDLTLRTAAGKPYSSFQGLRLPQAGRQEVSIAFPTGDYVLVAKDRASGARCEQKFSVVGEQRGQVVDVALK